MLPSNFKTPQKCSPGENVCEVFKVLTWISDSGILRVPKNAKQQQCQTCLMNFSNQSIGMDSLFIIYDVMQVNPSSAFWS